MKEATVIINTFKRLDFIKEAINSVINSNINRESYEIIVISASYNDDLIKFLENLSIKYICIDSVYNGERFAEAIKISEGELIFFMDDDDKFSPNKIPRVLDLFFKTNFDFYHNNFSHNEIDLDSGPDNIDVIKVEDDKDYKKILRLNINDKLNINSSSICIKKEFILRNLETAKCVTVGWDLFVYYLYLKKGFIFVDDHKILTFYRHHDKNYSLYNVAYLDDFLIQYKKNISDAIEDFRILEDISDNYIRKYVKIEFVQFIIVGNILGVKNFPKLKIITALNFLFNGKTLSLKFRLSYLLFYVISKFSKTLSWHFLSLSHLR